MTSKASDGTSITEQALPSVSVATDLAVAAWMLVTAIRCWIGSGEGHAMITGQLKREEKEREHP